MTKAKEYAKPPVNMYTVVKLNKYKNSIHYGNWVFDWNKFNNKILCYEEIEDANIRKRHLKRKHPRGEFRVTRNQEHCSNCGQLKPLKYLDFMGQCQNCMNVLYQDIKIAYLFPNAE